MGMLLREGHLVPKGGDRPAPPQHLGALGSWALEDRHSPGVRPGKSDARGLSRTDTGAVPRPSLLEGLWS